MTRFPAASFSKAFSLIKTYKIISVLVGVFVIGGAWYAFHAKTASASVIIQQVKVVRAPLSVDVTGSGTVSPTNTVTLKVKGSGDIRVISVKAGDVVKQGKALISLDATDAYRALQTAKVNLETAQLELDKIKEPADTVQVLQLKNQIADAQQAIKDQDLAVANAKRVLFNAGLQALPEVQMTSSQPPTITGSYLGTTEGQIKVTTYMTGDGLHFLATGLANGQGVASLTTPQPLGDSGLYITFGTLDAQPNWIISIPNKAASSYLSAYTSYQNALATRDKTDASEQGSLAQLQAQLDKLMAGADALDIRAKELAVAQRQNEVADAQAQLADYTVFAPFDGIIAGITAEVGDSVGPSTSLGTIITDKKVAEISLNEADISKVSVGQKATLTFDALQGVKLKGTVAQIDTLGSTTQGVVTYKVEIVFDNEEGDIKPGMTVNADIEIDHKDDVLVIPNEAIKRVKGKTYVEVPSGSSASSTAQVEITTGLSNDTQTEVVSGLDEGALVVIRRRTVASTSGSAQAPSLIGGGGGNASFRAGARGGF